MRNEDIREGMIFMCKRKFEPFYDEGRFYKSAKDHTIRDNFGVDYDVVLVNRYFELINNVFV